METEEELRSSPTRVKFSESTHDIRSNVSESQKTTSSVGSTAMDFELSLVMDIESGKCVLHTGSEKEKEKEDDFPR